jgi:uncharacterized membrane protein
MPFCNQCGNAVGARDIYCQRCGSRQPAAPPIPPAPPAGPDPLAGLSPRTASVLCYVPGIGWIAAIVVLASLRFRGNRSVRFHAFQGLYLFVAWMLNSWVLRPFEAMADFMGHMHVHSLVELILLGLEVFMMIKAAHDQTYSLPLFGELAERSLTD